jgi:hypothetical protein
LRFIHLHLGRCGSGPALGRPRLAARSATKKPSNRDSDAAKDSAQARFLTIVKYESSYRVQ